ncbi:Hypothetical predicted protein [Paramuricea clavata]|uniref:Uncharacterized protein n=1 Tax=Paramuricea clavata TaxID=317549 RepID=A0A6S7HBT2_PARCT|nr:Hypothetical predicted protein [Paramuricea clavata]
MSSYWLLVQTEEMNLSTKILMNTPQDDQLGYVFMKFDGCKEVIKFDCYWPAKT